jgi:hypothetical protein
MAQTSLNSTGVASSGSLVLQTNGTTAAVTVDTSQNVGVGVTPSAWGLGKALEVGNAGNAMWSVSSGDVRMMANAYYNGSNYIYSTTAAASYYRQSSSTHQWYTAPSGTAGNAITFTQAMTLDASGNLGVGVTDPATYGSVFLARPTSGANFGVRTLAGIGGSGTGVALDSLSNGAANVVDFGIRGNTIQFRNSGSEAARIDSSGNLNIGRTDTTGDKVNVYNGNTTEFVMLLRNDYPTTRNFVRFQATGTDVGSITSNGTITVYNTTSDYRLKNITGPLTGAKDFIMALQPKQGTWKSDGSKFVGFVAHEFQDVSPSSVTGNKDAVDEKGTPIMQSMQASSAEVMANLVAHIQNLETRLAALESN